MATFIAVCLLLFAVVGVLTPAVVWIERRQRALVMGRTARVRTDLLGVTAGGFFQPLAELIKWLARQDPLDPAAPGLISRLAPVVSWLAGLTVFAVVPFGGRYSIGAEPIHLAVADPAWGLLWVVVAAALAGLGVALTGIVGASTESRLGGIRAAAQSAAAVLALASSLLPMWVVYETLRPSEIGAWQDGVIRFSSLFATVGAVVPEWLPSGIGIPAWGILINPPAFMMFAIAAMVVVGRPPFDSPSASLELLGGVESELSGVRRVLFAASAHVWTLALSAVAVLLFLGGWSIPWLSQTTIVGLIEPYFGTGAANLVCGLVHVGCFFVKLAALVWIALLFRGSWPRLHQDRVVALCLRGIVPLALLDAGVTAAVALFFGGRSA